jgi:arylsulfatase A-like enzyme
MNVVLRAILKLVSAIYCALTSIYCLLAFLPYTYYALIKAPAYEWMPWFAQHHVMLYWLACIASVAGYWPQRRTKFHVLLLTTLAVFGLVLTFNPVLPAIQSNASAFAWSLAALAWILLPALSSLLDLAGAEQQSRQTTLIGYTGPLLAALLIGILSVAGNQLREYQESGSASMHWSTAELWTWSLVTHVVLALILVTGLDLLSIAARKTCFPRIVRDLTVAALVFSALFLACSRFLQDALSASPFHAYLYAGMLAATAVCFGRALAGPVLDRVNSSAAGWAAASRKAVLACLASALAAASLVLPSMVGSWDWDGIIQRVFVMILWLGLGVCICLPAGGRRDYSVPARLAVLLLVIFAYKGLQATEIFWGKPLGATDGDIAHAMERYGSSDISFQLAHHLLGNGMREEKCGDFCRILRQNTNIPDATVTRDLKLVDHLTPSQAERPDIFILVIDSMRPDYLGAYNPRVDFTPNIDSFARESIVFRNAYTQYAGTTLSEPAIWSGALLLHSHYVRPFEKVDSLEKLLNTDSYRMVVSYDTVLQQLLSPADHLTKLDTDKPWNQFEFCSTAGEFSNVVDSGMFARQPIFFYAQPMNVHQFAHNNQPTWKDTNWRRPGFNTARSLAVHQVDACLGRFFAFLKAHGRYDNSIIILASDHGDGSGNLGRRGHSLAIYPEVMHVPLIVHLPESMRGKLFYDAGRIATLTDITPTLYYLLGHRPIVTNPLFGKPLFARSKRELAAFAHGDLLFASDERAVYGILAENGRFLYTTYDSPARSFLFDLASDPNAQHSILTPELKRQYDQQILDSLKGIADFYGYRPGIYSLLAAKASAGGRAH